MATSIMGAPSRHHLRLDAVPETLVREFRERADPTAPLDGPSDPDSPAEGAEQAGPAGPEMVNAGGEGIAAGVRQEVLRLVEAEGAAADEGEGKAQRQLRSEVRGHVGVAEAVRGQGHGGERVIDVAVSPNGKQTVPEDGRRDEHGQG